MTLGQRLRDLAVLTLQDPPQGARRLLAEDVPLAARSAGLLLVAIVSALLATLQAGTDPQMMDPFSAFMLASPFRTAVMQWLFLALSVVLVYQVGRLFGGRGSFPDALLIVVWLQFLMLILQVAQLVAGLVSPALAGIIGLVGFGVFLWLMTTFSAELHAFPSRGFVFLGMVLTCLAVGFLLGIVMILIIGPEAFLNV